MKAFSPDTAGTLSTSLAGGWRFEGNSSDEVNGNNGTDTSVTYGATYGKIGQGAHLVRASSSRIVIPDSSALHFGSASRSVSIWFRTSTGAVNYQLIGNRNDNSTWWRIFTKSSSQLELEMGNSYPSSYKTFDTATLTYANNVWHHLVLVVDGVNLAWYFDGAAKGTGSWTPFSTDNSNGSIEIGCSNHSGYTDFWNGDIDEVYLWTKALSSTEIADLYNSGNGNTYVERSTSAIKTWNGLPDGSVKTVNGLARSSIKTRNGLA